MRALVFTVVVWACCTAMSFAAFFLGKARSPRPSTPGS